MDLGTAVAVASLKHILMYKVHSITIYEVQETRLLVYFYLSTKIVIRNKRFLERNFLLVNPDFIVTLTIK